MKFTNEVPPEDGYYLWRNTADSRPVIIEAENGYDSNGGLLSELGGEWCRLIPVDEVDGALMLVARIREALGDNGKRMQDELIEWCKTLRPKEEIEKAYHEGFADGYHNETPDATWPASEVKRVMEGLE